MRNRTGVCGAGVVSFGGAVALAGLLSVWGVGCADAAANAPVPVVPVTATQPAVPVAPVPVPVASAVVASTPDHVASELREQHRHHHHGGVTMFIAMSVDTLALAAEERAKVMAIQTALADSMASAQDAERAVMSILADDVQGGVVDPTRVGAAIAALAGAAATAQAATNAALMQLHAALTPLERATLVDKVQVHWTVWGRVNGVGRATDHADALDARLAELTDVLALTKDQADQIRAHALATTLDTRDVDARLQAFSTAFVADAFDAKAPGLSSPTSTDAWLAAAGATEMARFCEAATPVLDAGQRTKLAAHLREHLDHSDTATDTPRAM